MIERLLASLDEVTERLRALLDERGVEWWKTVTFIGATITDEGIERHYLVSTWWVSPLFGKVEATDMGNGVLHMACLNGCDFTPEQAVEATLGKEVTGETSDGYHTFDELYHHRAVLFSIIVRDHNELAWKSKRHHDGTMYDNMFIVGIETPTGQATYHYDIDPYWEMFDCKELERAPEWDGHSPDDAIERIATLGNETCSITDNGPWGYPYVCSACGASFDADVNGGDFNYCPNCGRKVVDE